MRGKWMPLVCPGECAHVFAYVCLCGVRVHVRVFVCVYVYP